MLSVKEQQKVGNIFERERNTDERKKIVSLGQNEILEKKEERNAYILKTLLRTA